MDCAKEVIENFMEKRLGKLVQFLHKDGKVLNDSAMDHTSQPCCKVSIFRAP
jgi:hypothetical protein